MRNVLNLRAGELVEVRSAQEILGTLDDRGTLDSLPFMPEMIQFCGKRFRVYRRADKACDTIEWATLRRMENTVHLEGLRCDGQAHGGCQAGCLLYWKEAWLERVPTDVLPPHVEPFRPPQAEPSGEPALAVLAPKTRKDLENSETVYSCQATELKRATVSELPWWNAGQYFRDIRSGNASARRVIRGLV